MMVAESTYHDGKILFNATRRKEHWGKDVTMFAVTCDDVDM